MSPPTFAELGLPSELVEVLDRKLITEPFEIQTLAVPDALVGRDILGRAPTGSGKTLAFGLPMMARLERGDKKLPRGLVLSPTRELAEQICRELEPLAKAMDREVLAVYGGVGLDRQIRALRKGVDVLVACPGRLLDLIEQRAVRLDDVDIVVVDEADRMADMGFLPDVRKLLDQTNEARQTLLFSATLDNDVQVLIDKYQNDPVVHEVGEVEPDLSIVDHRFIKVKKPDRIWLAADIIDDAGPTVIFVRTRHGVDRLARQLKQEGIRAGYIHGGRSQSQRDRALKVFIDGKVDALVATDVAARGIHVDGVACVIHYDPPADIKDYVHRSGRTARAGAEGTVVSFLDGPQVKESQKLQRRLSLESDVESPPARKPRSSRPSTVDHRDEAPKRSRGSRGTGGKTRKPKADRPERSAAVDGRRSTRSANGSRSRSADAEAAGRQTSNDGEPTARNGGRPARPAGKPAGRGGSARTSGSKPASGKPAKKRSSARSVTAGRRSSGDQNGSAGPRTSGGQRSSSGEKASGGQRGSTGEKASGGQRGSTGRKASGGQRGTGGQRGSADGAGGSAAGNEGGSRNGGRPGSGAKSSGAKRSTQNAAGPPQSSKRSGKPRPKNRKNKPKATGRK